MKQQEIVFALVILAFIVAIAWRKPKARGSVIVGDVYGGEFIDDNGGVIPSTVYEKRQYLLERFKNNVFNEMADAEISDVYTYVTQYIDKGARLDPASRLSKAIAYITNRYNLPY